MKEQQELGIKDVSRGGAEARSVADYKFERISPMMKDLSERNLSLMKMGVCGEIAIWEIIQTSRLQSLNEKGGYT